MENPETGLFDSSKSYIVLHYPMKKYIVKYFLIPNDLWASIPKRGLNLDLTLLELDLNWALLPDCMAVTKVFDHILSTGIGKGGGSTLVGSKSVSWESPIMRIGYLYRAQRHLVQPSGVQYSPPFPGKYTQLIRIFLRLS